MQNLQKFEIPEIVQFEKNQSKLTKMIITNDLAEAEIYLYGGNLTHFQPKGQMAVIFEGKKSEMHPDKTLHAGIPICWPWFGPHPTDSSKPQHGFARNRLWEVKAVEQLPTNETRVVLVLSEDEGTLELFTHPFELELTFVIGKELHIELKTFNSGTEPISFTQALHSYFYLSDIDNAVVYGVEETLFIDLADESREKSETAPLRIDCVINRVYEPTDSRCEIIDKGINRKIAIDKEGSNSTTIWNPGPNNGLHDLPGDLYRNFVCIETTNAHRDIITLEPGASHHIVQNISLSASSSK